MPTRLSHERGDQRRKDMRKSKALTGVGGWRLANKCYMYQAAGKLAGRTDSRENETHMQGGQATNPRFGPFSRALLLNPPPFHLIQCLPLRYYRDHDHESCEECQTSDGRGSKRKLVITRETMLAPALATEGGDLVRWRRRLET